MGVIEIIKAEREALKLKLRRNTADSENPSADQLIPLCEAPDNFGCGPGLSFFGDFLSLFLVQVLARIFIFLSVYLCPLIFIAIISENDDTNVLLHGCILSRDDGDVL